METAIMIGCIAMTALLVAAYVLVLGARRSDREEEAARTEPAVVITPRFSSAPVAELEETKDDIERARAEEEYVAPHPLYAEPEEDLEKFEIYLDNARNSELPRCIRMVSGMFLKGYESLEFMEQLLRRLEPVEAESVLDAMEMGRNPKLYLERHPVCSSECRNDRCPFCSADKSIINGALAAVPVMAAAVSAQNANAIGNGMNGITQATSEISSYFNPVTKLIYAIGAIVGLIGAVRVYSKFSSGDPDTTKVAATWFGACIFLVIAATVLSGFFF